MEIDMPAHASSLCVGYPQLCANASNGRDGHCGWDVSRNATFEFVDGLVTELATPVANNATANQALFFEDFFHLGGDEVDTRCWGPPPGTNANISGTYGFDIGIWEWLKANGNLSYVGFRDMGNYNPTTMQVRCLISIITYSCTSSCHLLLGLSYRTYPNVLVHAGRSTICQRRWATSIKG